MKIPLEKFCTCTQTYQRHSQDIDPYPWEPESLDAIALLFDYILDPIIEHYGQHRFILTYGFCSIDLKKFLEKGRNQTCAKVDQHCSHELNLQGFLICQHGGAAADLRIEGVGSSRLIREIKNSLPIDSCYFYGDNRPIHVSYGASHRRAFWNMETGQPRPLR